MLAGELPNELYFSMGESLDELAVKLRTAFESGSTSVAVACEDPDFPEVVVSNGIIYDGKKLNRAAVAVLESLEKAGAPVPLVARLERKEGMPANSPYSKRIVYEKPGQQDASSPQLLQ